jgi:hypothetical protein
MRDNMENESIDAVIVPRDWRGFVREDAMYAEIKREFGAAMGATSDPYDFLYMRKDTRGNGRTLVTHHPDHLLRFAKDHPKTPGRDRYVWRDGPDGCLLGTLTDEARADWEAEHPT